MELVDVFNRTVDWLWSYDKTNINADVELRDVGMTCMNSQMGSSPCPHHSWLSCIAIRSTCNWFGYNIIWSLLTVTTPDFCTARRKHPASHFWCFLSSLPTTRSIEYCCAVSGTLLAKNATLCANTVVIHTLPLFQVLQCTTSSGLLVPCCCRTFVPHTRIALHFLSIPVSGPASSPAQCPVQPGF